MSGHLTPEEHQERIDLYNRLGSANKVAQHLGMNRKSIDKWVIIAKRKGWIGEHAGMVPAGHEVGSVSRAYDRYGNQVKETIHTRPERQPYEQEEGYEVKGRSTLIDADGNVASQWVKTNKERLSLEKTIEVIQAAFKGYKPVTPNISKPKEARSDMLTVYPVLDWHIGMFAYGKETGGPDWDLSIARKQLCSTFSELVEQTPPSGRAIFLGLGDLLHSDNNRNRTERSGNPLDVDTRHQKILETACDIMAECSELVASKHQKVTVVFKRGNHDETSNAAILQAIRMMYRNHKRVEVATSPNPFFWTEFGVNLIGGTHGDQQKIDQLPMIMATRCKEAWGRTKTRHVFTGHVHHERAKEVEGVKCFSLRAPIPVDAWHAGVGYSSGRSMYGFNYHSELGSRGNIEVEIA